MAILPAFLAGSACPYCGDARPATTFVAMCQNIALHTMAEENQQQKISEEEPSEPSTIPPIGEKIVVVPRQFFGGNNTPQKTEWPELVGSTAEEGEKKIKEEMPGARVQVVPPGCFVTMDYNTQRVRLYVDSTGKVVRPPGIG